MRLTCMMAFAALLFTTAACEKSNSDNPGDGEKYTTKDPRTGDGFVMLTEKSLYDKLKLASGDEKGRTFEIEKVSRDGNILIVKVTCSAGCTAPSFDVVWDGRVMMSYPYKINLVLKMKADACEDSQQKASREIKIDLKEHVEDFAADKETVFSLINASNKKLTDYDSAKHN